MKKNIISILMISLVLLLTLASCSPNNGSTSVRTVRVIGTAKAVDGTTRTAGQKYVIDSVTEVKVNGVNIVDKLVPVDPDVTDGQNNVEFKAEVEVPERTTLEAAPAKDGFVFDEWEVLDDDEAAADEALLDKIEDWLEDTNQEHKEKLNNVPAEYIPYIVAEYDRGYYIDLGKTENGGKGTKAEPFSVEDFKALNHQEEELTLVLVGKDTNNSFKALIEHIDTINLEELKLRATEDTAISALPKLSNLEEVKLSGFTFATNIELSHSGSEYEFDGCNFSDLTINGGEIEIDGGTAKNVTINSGEVEIERMKIEGNLDLSNLSSDDVEIEDVTCGTYIKPSNSNIKPEIKKLVETKK